MAAESTAASGGTEPAAVPPATGAAPVRGFIDVRDLVVHFKTDDGIVKAVDGLSFSVERGRTLGIVGESGSGKSVTSLSIMGLNRGRNTRMSGEVWLNGKELVKAGAEEVRALRGSEMAMIFQDPLSAMHPYYTVGSQIAEAYRVHNDVSRKAAHARAIEMLELVGIPSPRSRVDHYPHEFSGGMRQRAMIAMALSCNPHLLIADEPTTALDVTVQAQILDLMRNLQKEFDSAIILITHDLGVIAEATDEVLVMYAGRAVEYAPVKEMFAAPEHPYTWGLLQSMTRLDRDSQKRLRPVAGSPPSLIDVPPGCPFHPRCPYDELSSPASREIRPELLETVPGHLVACHLKPEQRRELFRTEVSPTL